MTITVRGRASAAVRRWSVLAGALAVGVAAAVSPACAEEPLSEAQTRAVEALVERYIAENPDKILEAVRAYNQRQEEEQRAEAESNLVARHDEIVNDPASPVAGNPDGDVTVVEFFDYRCGYCKRSLDVLMAVMQEDPNVRVVFKEFPILSPQSLQAARAALASRRQDKYFDFHVALMGARGTFDDEQIFDIAHEVGLDVDRLIDDMQSPEIEAHIDAVNQLARALDIGGTPAFVVGGEIYRGAIDLDTMRSAIAATRAS